MGVTLRDANEDDAAAIAAIYRHYVENSVATFEEVAPGEDEIRARIKKTLAGGFPYHVALDGTGAVIGYCYAGPFHARLAYRFTVENSVYVRHGLGRQGIGTLLMRALIGRMTELGYRQMMAVISGSSASIPMHARLGFREVGRHPSLGLKFGQWVDVVVMQLALGEGGGSLPAGEPRRTRGQAGG
jgi:phosphinothricin acetyltransferase